LAGSWASASSQARDPDARTSEPFTGLATPWPSRAPRPPDTPPARPAPPGEPREVPTTR
jgi:hypothetical protein